MAHIGGERVEFRLPSPEPWEPKKKLEERVPRKLRLWAGLAILAGLWVVFWPVSRRDARLPVELQGVWVTSTPAYADRFMEFTPVSLIFGTGGTSGEVYFVRNVERVVRPDGLEFAIEYRDASEAEYRVGLLFRPGEPPTVQLQNQSDIVWVPRVAEKATGAAKALDSPGRAQ